MSRRYGLPSHQTLPEHWPLTSLEDWVADVSQLPYLLRPRTLRMAHEDGVLSNFPSEVVPEKKSKSIELVPPESGHVPFEEYVRLHPDLSEQELWDEFVSHERCCAALRCAVSCACAVLRAVL